ncbi:MAG: ATPase [Acidothermus cellulolyticus]|nr:ATPase [Acidothermus cellulolyticus]
MGVDRDWEGVRLHVVTGKGGTGKTTVAAALALALASDGRRTLLVECEGRQGIARLFDTPPLPYAERKLAVAPGEGMVYGLAIDPEQALLEYLEMYYHLGRPARVLQRVGAIDFATTIAPGLRDVLLTGKVYEATRRRFSGSRPARTAARIVRHDGVPADAYVYDAVVLDAPPTGRITRFLNVNAEVADLARVGPINRQAASIMSLLRSPQTAVHLVTVLEDMPVQETLDGIAELRRQQLPVGAIVINRVQPAHLPTSALRAVARGEVDTAALQRGLAKLGIAAEPSTVDALAAETIDAARTAVRERRLRHTLSQAGRPTYDLPELDIGDIARLYTLAAALREQGAA